MNVPDESLFAVAGTSRSSIKGGNCFGMTLREAAGNAVTMHSQMPVIIGIGDHAVGLEQAMPDAFGLCRPWTGQFIVNRTDMLWASR